MVLGTHDQGRGIGAHGERGTARETHTRLAIRQTIIDGDSAGPLVVPGIDAGDDLLWVLLLSGTDLTDEFDITDDDEISNDPTAGTDTAGGVLLVGWQR
jgi:hypothetical protein